MALGRLIMMLIMMITLAMGGAALLGGLRLVFTGTSNMAGAVTAAMMGLALAGVALAYFYFSLVRRPVVKAREDETRSRFPQQPWMLREDWAARKLTSSTGGIATLMWLWSAGWWAFLIVIGTVNRAKIAMAIEESWWNAALLAIFVGVGVTGILTALEFTRRTRRYGASTLELETLPFFVGEKGTAVFTARLGPSQRGPLAMTVACDEVEWVTTGYGNSRRTRLVVKPISATTTAIVTRSFVPTRNGLRGRVSIEIPQNLPAYARDQNGNGIRWTLRIATTGNDEPFSCEFEIPVFHRT